MYRFIVDKKEDNCFIFSNETLSHIKVLRLKKDENFICIYNNEFYQCVLENNKALIVNKLSENHENKNRVVLFAAIINLKRFEWLVQKATELGATDFYPLITKNTNNSYKEQISKKISRYKEIIKNATEQSFRNKLMAFHDPINFEQAIQFEIDNKFIAHEKNNIDSSSFNFKGNIAFFVGPEGGFTDEEIVQATKMNIKTVSLGKRILRSETASIFLLSNIDLNN